MDGAAKIPVVEEDLQVEELQEDELELQVRRVIGAFGPLTGQRGRPVSPPYS